MQTYIDDTNYTRNGSYRLEPETIPLVNHYLSDVPEVSGYDKTDADQTCVFIIFVSVS